MAKGELAPAIHSEEFPKIGYESETILAGSAMVGGCRKSSKRHVTTISEKVMLQSEFEEPETTELTVDVSSQIFMLALRLSQKSSFLKKLLRRDDTSHCLASEVYQRGSLQDDAQLEKEFSQKIEDSFCVDVIGPSCAKRVRVFAQNSVPGDIKLTQHETTDTTVSQETQNTAEDTPAEAEVVFQERPHQESDASLVLERGVCRIKEADHFTLETNCEKLEDKDDSLVNSLSALSVVGQADKAAGALTTDKFDEAVSSSDNACPNSSDQQNGDNPCTPIPALPNTTPPTSIPESTPTHIASAASSTEMSSIYTKAANPVCDDGVTNSNCGTGGDNTRNATPSKSPFPAEKSHTRSCHKAAYFTPPPDLHPDAHGSSTKVNAKSVTSGMRTTGNGERRRAKGTREHRRRGKNGNVCAGGDTAEPQTRGKASDASRGRSRASKNVRACKTHISSSRTSSAHNLAAKAAENRAVDDCGGGISGHTNSSKADKRPESDISSGPNTAVAFTGGIGVATNRNDNTKEYLRAPLRVRQTSVTDVYRYHPNPSPYVLQVRGMHDHDTHATAPWSMHPTYSSVQPSRLSAAYDATGVYMPISPVMNQFLPSTSGPTMPVMSDDTGIIPLTPVLPRCYTSNGPFTCQMFEVRSPNCDSIPQQLVCEPLLHHLSTDNETQQTTGNNTTGNNTTGNNTTGVHRQMLSPVGRNICPQSSPHFSVSPLSGMSPVMQASHCDSNSIGCQISKATPLGSPKINPSPRMTPIFTPYAPATPVTTATTATTATPANSTMPTLTIPATASPAIPAPVIPTPLPAVPSPTPTITAPATTTIPISTPATMPTPTRASIPTRTTISTPTPAPTPATIISTSPTP